MKTGMSQPTKHVPKPVKFWHLEFGRPQNMGAHNYEELRRHIGHRIVCVCYGTKGQTPDNVAIECETCNEVLFDYDA